MKKITLNHDSDSETAIVERRNFLKYSMLGGMAAALFSPSLGYGMSDTEVLADECQGVTAADLLALFSSLAWKLPNQLKAADKARDEENKIYKDFNALYNELVDLAKQLKIKCDAVSQKDPRMQEIFELVNVSQNNVRYVQTVSTKERELAYLQLATLAVAARQVARSANEILPEKIVVDDPDNKIICQMLEKINEMQNVKMQLDVARKSSTDLFKSFIDSIGNLNKIILNASESAAKAGRGEIRNEEAVRNIDDAKVILKKLNEESLVVENAMITPEQLSLLLDVPRAMLNKEIPDVQVSERYHGAITEFRTAGYILPDKVADANYSRIAKIISDNIRPSGWWTVSLLATTCLSVLMLYRDAATRKPLIKNALQSVPWVESGSNFGQAATSIASIRV
jgi:hypothetical protein